MPDDTKGEGADYAVEYIPGGKVRVTCRCCWQVRGAGAGGGWRHPSALLADKRAVGQWVAGHKHTPLRTLTDAQDAVAAIRAEHAGRRVPRAWVPDA